MLALVGGIIGYVVFRSISWQGTDLGVVLGNLTRGLLYVLQIFKAKQLSARTRKSVNKDRDDTFLGIPNRTRCEPFLLALAWREISGIQDRIVSVSLAIYRAHAAEWARRVVTRV